MLSLLIFGSVIFHIIIFYQDSGEKPETMSSKDAAMFPIIASCTLFGIYLVFQVRVKDCIVEHIYVNLHEVISRAIVLIIFLLIKGGIK